MQISGNRNKFGAPKRPRTLFNDKATIPSAHSCSRTRTALVTTREIAERGGMSIGMGVTDPPAAACRRDTSSASRGGGTRVTDPPRLLERLACSQYTFEHNAVFPFRMREPRVEDTLQLLRTLQPPFSSGTP